MIASALAPNEIIIVGDITTVWYMFGKSRRSRIQTKRSLEGAETAAFVRWQHRSIAQRRSAGDERKPGLKGTHTCTPLLQV